MPRSAGGRGGELPLPSGWDLGRDYDGKVYFIDHNSKKTTWIDPRDSLTKPQSFADCVGDELPVGWEQVIDYNRGVYYINHVEKQVQVEDPRLEWRALQEEMLRQYLTTAQEDLQAKRELVAIKQARLSLAQDEYRNLNTTLSTLSTSTTSYDCIGGGGDGNISGDLDPYNGYEDGLDRSVRQPSELDRRAGVSGKYTHIINSYSPCPGCSSCIHCRPEYGSAPSYSNLLSPTTTSNQSLNSTTSSTSTKYDPDLLKSDVSHAKARVQRLKRELANINSEMDYKAKGVETLSNVNSKFSDPSNSLTQEEEHAIRNELQSIQKSLVTGEMEKIELMKSLACLKEDLTRLEPSDSSLDTSLLNPQEKFSTASQTDLSGEMVPVGARLAELARLRLQYDESRRHVQELQQRLARLEERISPGQLESDNDRILLIQEKEQLLRELRSINSRTRSKHDMEEVRMEIRKLESDLNNATEISNKCIAERLKIHEEKRSLLQELKDSMRSVAGLESQLKLLSASTLSMSSSSSLGSLSSSHASSKGSLSSLSFTDIYGMSSTAQPDSSMLDLHRRVEKILIGSRATGNASQTELASPEEYSQGDQSLCVGKPMSSSSSQPSLSPRSSLSSVSPPVSPALPPSYHQAYLTSLERQKRLQAALPPPHPPLPAGLYPSPPTNLQLQQHPGAADSVSHLSPIYANSAVLSPNHSPVKRTSGGGSSLSYIKTSGQLDLGELPAYSSSSSTFSTATATPPSVLLRRGGGHHDSVGSDQSSAPLSPISETNTAAAFTDRCSGVGTSVGVGGSFGGGGNHTPSSGTTSNPRSVSAAISDESVAGDSGVFEASSTKRDYYYDEVGGGGGGGGSGSGNGHQQLGLCMSLETAQVQVKLRYSTSDNLLHVGIERARNLTALFIPEGRNICIKASLLPSLASFSYTFCTRAISDLSKPTFGESFPVAISKSKLASKTLQVNVWAVDGQGREDCLGSAQVSMADFKLSTTSVKWYNVLSFHFMQPEIKRPASSPRPQPHSKQESEISCMTNSRQGTLKEESSDESTIISSQTSTLTRNLGPEAMLLAQNQFSGAGEDGAESDDDFQINEDAAAFLLSVQQQQHQQQHQRFQAHQSPVNPQLHNSHQENSAECHGDGSIAEDLDLTPPAELPHHDIADKETNTECVFIQPPVIIGGGRKGSVNEMGLARLMAATSTSTVVKRSKTFSPSAPINKSQYNCRLNRSDSDSAMPLYRRLPFQRISKERRSLHVPTGVGHAGQGVGSAGVAGKSSGTGGGQNRSNLTSLDLELDLAAQHSRLQILRDEIDRLKTIKARLEEAKGRGERELPVWLQEDEKFQHLLSMLEQNLSEKSPEERRMEKLLRKTAKEIYKLRKTKTNKGQLDVQSFREKMAFLSCVKSTVPLLSEASLEEEEDELEDVHLFSSPGYTKSPYCHSGTPPASTCQPPLYSPRVDVAYRDTSTTPSGNTTLSSSTQSTPTPTPVLNTHHHHNHHHSLHQEEDRLGLGEDVRRVSDIDIMADAVAGTRTTETVDTLTGSQVTATSPSWLECSSSSQTSTPTPIRQTERFSYEVDPELGAFV